MPPDKILSQKGKEGSKMIKNHNFERKICDSGSFDENPSKMGKSEQKGCHVKTIEQLNFFHQKMSHIILLKLTKFQQPLLITLRVADEKPEGGQKAPPHGR